MYLNMILVAQMLRSEIRQNVNNISDETSLQDPRAMPSYSSLHVFLDILLTENANEYKHDFQEGKKGEVHLDRKNAIPYLIDQLKSR